MQSSNIVCYGPLQNFFTYKASSFPYTQNFDRTILYGVSTERISTQVQAGFGRTITFSLKQRQFDYIDGVVLSVRLPEIKIPVTDPDMANAKFAWCRNLGNLIIDYIQLKIGGTSMIQQMTGYWFQLQTELLYPYAKKNLLSKLNGNDRCLTSLSSPDKNGVLKPSKTILINLPLSFTLSREDALPILMMDGMTCDLEVTFASNIRNVIITNSILDQYISNFEDYKDTHFYLHGVVVNQQYKCLLKSDAKYFYIFKDVECKTHSSSSTDDSIKITQAGTCNVVEAYCGTVKCGNFSGKKFLTYKFENDEHDDDIVQRAADRLADSMIFLYPRDASAQPATQPDLTKVPSKWLGTNNENAANIKLLVQTTNFVPRSTTDNGCIDGYLKIKVPSIVYTTCDVYVCLNTLRPKERTQTNFSFCDKIDEILVDCIFDTTVKRETVTASKHRLNMRDISLPIDFCDSFRDTSKTVDDLTVHDQFNTGLLVNGKGHWIDCIKYQILGYTHEEAQHESFVALQLLFTQWENVMERAGFFIIPFTGCLRSRVWPDGTIDLSRLDQTELKYNLVDRTQYEYKNSPFPLIPPGRGANPFFDYFSLNVRSPIYFAGDFGIKHITDAAETKQAVDEMIFFGNKFSLGKVVKQGELPMAGTVNQKKVMGVGNDGKWARQPLTNTQPFLYDNAVAYSPCSAVQPSGSTEVSGRYPAQDMRTKCADATSCDRRGLRSYEGDANTMVKYPYY